MAGHGANIDRLVKDFLEQHQNADQIVWDTENSVPRKAVYNTIKGIPRTYLVEYYFEDLCCSGLY